jgi:glycosyltransferase involved in cell wall biosynthesis
MMEETGTKRISIITPCRNAERYIGETVESVVSQSALLSGRAELEYIICDGLSTDRTVEIAEFMTNGFQHGTVRIVKQRDVGMYDALAHGLSMASGDICAYINAGDYYSKHAFDIVLDLFEWKKVKWLTGFSTVYNEQSHLVEFYLPFRYRARLFACGCYGTLLSAVQQESTFWNTELNRAINYETLTRFKYAGDFYLWHQFSQCANLNIVAAYIGGFKRHQGQLSENREAYLLELDQIINHRKAGIVDRLLAGFDSVMWKLPPVVKKHFNQRGLYRFDHERQEWV